MSPRLGALPHIATHHWTLAQGSCELAVHSCLIVFVSLHFNLFLCCFVLFLFLLGAYLQHMEVPRLGAELELQLPDIAIADGI